MIGAAAGAPLAQQKGTDTERAAQDQNTQARETDASQKAAKAEGVGETEEDHEAADRDADGRRIWERNQADGERPEEESDADASKPTSRDASGERGNRLDLSG